MDIWQTLLDVVVLLGAGALLGGLLERMRQSAIVGYLLAGVLLGPNVLHVVQSHEQVVAVSELGVALLLFAIGLEFSWARLKGMGSVALGSGAIQVLGTIGLATAVALAAGLSAGGAVAIGAICALSSTACVMRVLTARGELESRHSERALGVLLVQDIAVVPLVLVVALLAEGGTAGEFALGLARATGVGLGLVAGLYLVFHQLVPRLLAAGPVHSNRELPLLLAVVSGLGSGVIAHKAGMSPALGAFVAGLLLAESPFAIQVRADVSALKTLLLTLFFTAMGMLADPAWIASNALLVLGVVALVLAGKGLVVYGALRLVRTRAHTAAAAALCLSQVGEFSFVLADLARGTLLSQDAFLLVVSVIVITMILTPYLVAGAPALALMVAGASPRLERDRPADEPATIVIGFGPAGRAASERIADGNGPVLVVEQNPGAAADAKKLGYGVIVGDALQGEVLDHAHLGKARAVVITIPVADAALALVHLVRQRVPGIPVLVRARFHRSLAALQEAGAQVVVDEEYEVGRQIAKAYREALDPGERPAAD